uniref:Uncharacterized protein n=1 Tax=Rhizophora mucronata TaxID=61149 RepID=A0A2P2LRH6_RHIMU
MRVGFLIAKLRFTLYCLFITEAFLEYPVYLQIKGFDFLFGSVDAQLLEYFSVVGCASISSWPPKIKKEKTPNALNIDATKSIIDLLAALVIQ